jgi:hypothetical protein
MPTAAEATKEGSEDYHRLKKHPLKVAPGDFYSLWRRDHA